MKHAKKMIFKPTSITSDPIKSFILEFEKEINDIFERRELAVEERINLYNKTLNKYELLHSNNLNNNKEDENMDGYIKNRENGDQEIFYELQDPNRLGQDNDGNTDTLNGQINTSNPVASINELDTLSTIPLAPSRTLNARDDVEEIYDDRNNIDYLFPSKKVKLNNHKTEEEKKKIIMDNSNETIRPQILSANYYDDMSIEGDEEEEEEEMELEEERGIKRKSDNIESNIKRFRESNDHFKNRENGVKRKGNQLAKENYPPFKRLNDGEDYQFFPADNQRGLKRRTEFNYGEEKRSRDDFRALKRLNNSEENYPSKKRRLDELISENRGTKRRTEFEFGDKKRSREEHRGLKRKISEFSSSEDEEEQNANESIYNKKKRRYKSVLNDKAKLMKRKLVFDEFENGEPFDKKIRQQEETDSDDESRVGIDILPIKNQRIYGTEEDEIINLKRKRSGLDSMPNKRQRIYENQPTTLKRKRSGIDFVPYKKQRVDDLKWTPYKLSNIH